MDNKKELKAVSFKCDGCGSGICFDPQTQNLKCPSCGKVKTLTKTYSKNKHDITEVKEEKRNAWIAQTKIVKCETCGAEIILNKLEFSGICPYCNSSYVSETKELPDMVPDSVIPFCFDENEAEKRFKLQLKRKFYVPNPCKRNVKPENIKGVYIPAFTFDASVRATYSGTLRRQVNNEVEFFTISGEHKSSQVDVMVESSSKLTQESLKKILPYDMEKSCSFSEGFVLGYVVEHYQDVFQECLQKAQTEMQQRVKREILSKYTYDSVKEFNFKCGFSNQKYQYAIVPIYQINFWHKKKRYNVIMNGQTGKIGGKLPISAIKVGFTILAWVAFIALLIFLSYC